MARELRTGDRHTPIIFLTARAATDDVVKGFETGGNDYLKKPFSMEELIVRIQALLRTSSVQAESADGICEIGEYSFDPTRQLLKIGDDERQLTHRESEILHRLFQNKNRLMERKPVLLELWGDDSFFNGRSMDVFITKLRKYLKKDPNVQIVNVRGKGYKLVI
ncbi:MAG: response regulator transcription factor [Bacteroidota bacterium]